MVTAGCQRSRESADNKVAIQATYITSDFHAALMIKVQRLLDSSLVTLLNKSAGDQYLEEFLEQLNLRYNVRFQDLARYTMIATSIADPPGYPSEIADVLQYRDSADVEFRNQQLIGDHSRITIGPRSYFRSKVTQGASTYWLNPTTVARGPERHVKQMITGSRVNRRLAGMVEAALVKHDAVFSFSIDSLRPESIRELQATPSNSPLYPWVTGLPHMESVLVAVNLTDQPALQLTLSGHHGRDAAEIAQRATRGLAALKELLDSQLGMAGEQAAGSSQAVAFRLARETLDQVTLQLSGNQVIVGCSLDEPRITQLVQAIGSSVRRSMQERFRILARSRLDQVGSGLLAFYQAHGHLPVGNQPPLQTRDGKPLLSWRVHLLPYLKEDKLYQQFHLDEPWNSPHNITLVEQIPHAYTSPQYGDLQGRTTYLAPGGSGTVLGGAQAMGFEDITDGAGQTILVLQVGPDKAMEWTRPGNLEFTATDTLDRLGDVGDYIPALFADGRVFHLDPGIRPRILRALFQYQDGIRLDRRRLRR